MSKAFANSLAGMAGAPALPRGGSSRNCAKYSLAMFSNWSLT
jgi:hypothetical protein